jgi:hypothetical protein
MYREVVQPAADGKAIRCIWCGVQLAECLVRLGATSCHDCRAAPGTELHRP